MKICIGIISYFPDDERLRKVRSEKLDKVLRDCNNLFNLPVIIIAQNWKNIRCSLKNVNVLYYENKLGITGARRELRRVFLESEYDYLIMLDDDAKLIGTPEDAYYYLNQIQEHPGKWFGVYKTFLLKLFAISKEMFKEIDYPKGEAEDGAFFEDMYLIMALEKKFPKNKFVFKRTSLNDVSDSANDPDSTWYHRQYNKHDIGDRTRAMIKEL